ADHRRDPQDDQLGKRLGHARGVLGGAVVGHEADHHPRVSAEDACRLHLAAEAFLRPCGDDAGEKSLAWLGPGFHAPSRLIVLAIARRGYRRCGLEVESNHMWGAGTTSSASPELLRPGWDPPAPRRAQVEAGLRDS